jgi:hypothetical protein
MFKEKKFERIPENVKKNIKRTLFLVETLDDIENFLTPGVDYKVITHIATESIIRKYPSISWGFMYNDKFSPDSPSFFNKESFEKNEIDEDEFENIWVFNASQWVDDLKYLGKKVFAIDSQLFEKLNNKFEQSKLISNFLDKSNFLNFINEKKSVFKTEITLKNPKYFDSFIKRFQLPFVVSGSLSDSGSGIFLIKNYSDFIKAIFQIKSPVIRVEKFIECAVPLSQMAIVFGNKRILKYQPSIQIITNLIQENHFEYIGNDFVIGPHLKHKYTVIDKVNNLTDKVGQFLHSVGYRGIFGCDYLVKGKNIYFVELNPRYVGSIILLTRIASLLLNPHLLHIFSFIRDDSPDFIETDYLDIVTPDNYQSFVRIYNDNGDRDLLKPPGNIRLDKNYCGYKIFKNSIIKKPNFPTSFLSEIKIV